MGVTFVYRSYYEHPTGRFVRRYEESSLPEWFANRWHGATEDDAYEMAKGWLGCGVYGAGSIPQAIAESDAPAPTSDDALADFLSRFDYPEGEILVQPGAIQVATDDDEIDLAWYLFDDRFASAHPERCEFLMRTEAMLPTNVGSGPFDPGIAVKSLAPAVARDGATYAAFLTVHESCCLTEMQGPVRLNGVRLPDLARFLATVTPKERWPWELKLLRSQCDPDSARATVAAAIERVRALDQSALFNLQQSAHSKAIKAKQAAGWDDYWTGPVTAVAAEVAGYVQEIDEKRRPSALIPSGVRPYRTSCKQMSTSCNSADSAASSPDNGFFSTISSPPAIRCSPNRSSATPRDGMS